MASLRERLSTPVHASSLVAFRVLFGLAGLVACLRFVGMGWMEELLLAPRHHLHYADFEWVVEPSPVALRALFATMALSAGCIALGLYYRVAVAAYFLAFTYVELIDQALYLNHYYAVSLIAFLLFFLPLGEVGSLDAWRRDRHRTSVPAWALYVVRAQLGLIYFFAGVAKLHPDWWGRAEPLRTWLLARTDLPLLGPLFHYEAAAYVMAWAGLVFDLTVPFFLVWKRSRPFAYAAVVVFHGITGSMFRIGLFPLLMILWTPVFFEPDWPERVVAFVRRRPLTVAPPEPTPALPKAGAVALAAWFAVQFAMPLRHYAIPGDLLWTYEGFNWAWHVMIVEKGAHADLVVVDRDSGERFFVTPDEYYTRLQTQVMSENPELVVQFAHLVASDFRHRGHAHVAVYARSYASLNGRPVQTLVDPRVDLTTIGAFTPASRYVVPLADHAGAWPGYRLSGTASSASR